jgi:hypothetical protein
MHFSKKAFSNKCGGQLSVELVGRVGIILGRPPFRSGASRLQVSLVGESQDGGLLQNTWCSGTSCGGIDPYTLIAPHGPRQTRWPNSPKRAARTSELLGEPCGASRYYLMVKETKSVRIDIVSSVDTTVVIG